MTIPLNFEKLGLVAVLTVSLASSFGFTIWYTDNHAPYLKDESAISDALEQLTEKTQLQTVAIKALTETVHSQNIQLTRVTTMLDLYRLSPSPPEGLSVRPSQPVVP